jgi:hypothetical protein
MYHYYREYASLGIDAIAYYKGLSRRDKSFIDNMTAAILKAAHPTRRSVAQKVSPKSKKIAKPALR